MSDPGRADDGNRIAPEPDAKASGEAPTSARQWLKRIRRTSQATPPDTTGEGFVPPTASATTLLNRSPFQIGFVMTLGVMVALGLVNVLVSLQSVALLVVFSLFLALGLNPAVEWLHRRHVARGVAVVLVTLIVLGLLALGAWAVLPVASEQINLLVQNAPLYLQQLRENPQIAQFDAQFQVIEKVTDFITSGAWLTTIFGGLLGAGRIVANTVFSLIVTLVLTIYFLASLPSIKNVIYSLAPASRRPRVRYLANEMFRRIGGYMSGMFIVVTCSATTAFIFMNIVGLGQFSLALTVVVATFAFIPLVGSTASMIVVSVVAFAFSPTTGLITLLFFLTYQQIDTYVIQPRVFQRSVNVPGVLVILAAISGGLLLGIAGALLAIPTMASLLLLYQEVIVPKLEAS